MPALAAARHLRGVALGLGVLGALVFAAMAWLLAGRFSLPLARIAVAARAIESGQTDVAIPQEHSTREFAELCQSIAGMKRTLQQANETLEQRVYERTAALQTARAQLQLANAELDRQASRDALTGLLNRRASDALPAREIERHRRYRQPLALMLADIDRFKSVNDTQGHAAGDAVLGDVAAVLQSACRNSDAVVRQGGEEFLIVMPETEAGGAAAAAEKLRAAVAEHTGRTRVTLSLGVATDVQDHADAATALQAADSALYAAKRGGRNRVELAPLPQPQASPAQGPQTGRGPDPAGARGGEAASRGWQNPAGRPGHPKTAAHAQSATLDGPARPGSSSSRNAGRRRAGTARCPRVGGMRLRV